jgi:ComEC/Rec2-related protein
MNFRALFFIFLIGVLCIYFSFRLSFSSPLNLLFFIFPLGFLALLGFKKKFVLLVFSVIFFTAGSLGTFFYFKNYNDTSFSNTPVTLTGKIEKVTAVSNNFYYLTLSNISVVREDETFSTLNGCVSTGVYATDEEQTELALNSQIVFATTLSGVSATDEDGTLNNFYLKWNIRYQTDTLSFVDVTNLGDASTLIEKLQTYNRTLLVDNFGETKGNLLYSVLYGDKSFTDSEILSLFSYSGVIHILSVSGLHVGLLVFLLMLFLNKTSLKDYLKFIIVALFLFSFCLLTNFSSSTIRASIMSLVVILSMLFERKNDYLNSISFAGILILLFHPTSLFDVGFQMSFASVFGIILVANSARVFIKSEKLFKILSPILTTLGAELMLFPIIANVYGVVPVWSVLFNLVVLPVFSVMYSILFIVNILVVAMPFLSFLYFLPNALLDVVLFIVSAVSYLPANIVSVPAVSIFATAIYYATFFVISKYVVISAGQKVTLAVAMLLVFCTIVVFGALPATSSQNIFTFYESESCLGTLFATDQNKFYLVEPDLYDSYSISKQLEKLNISKLSGIIMLTNSSFESAEVYEYLADFSPAFYLPSNSTHNASLSAFGFSTTRDGNTAEKIVVDDYFCIEYSYYNYNSVSYTPLGLTIEIQTQKIVFLNAKLTLNENLQNSIQTNFDYCVNCVRMIDREDSADWRQAFCAEQYYFDSSTAKSFVVS